MNTRGMLKWSGALFCSLLCVWPDAAAQETSHVKGPLEHIYRTVDGRELKAFVFEPAKRGEQRAAVVLFHGGGWTIGEPAWAFGPARHFAELGLVAVAVQYRLSDQKSVTPVEAMEDARAAIQWTRSHAHLFDIHPDRIVAYGWSAGGHLAACTAIFPGTAAEEKTSSAPNALILLSPALRLETDSWAQRLLVKRGNISSISPVSHIRRSLPPTLILQGSDDTVTPLEGARLFADRMISEGNRCVLQVYPGVGHMFTPKGKNDSDTPQPDPKVEALASQKGDEFLVSLGFLK